MRIEESQSRFKRLVLYYAALVAGRICAVRRKLAPGRPTGAPAADLGVRPTRLTITVVIPSRNGKELLARVLPGAVRELEGIRSEIIIVDNGSEDGTAEFLRSEYPGAMVEESPVPLSFARAVNRGIARAQSQYTCLLNNDMVLERGFFAALLDAFEKVPELFCATAQIFFPEGVRREETGKAVMPDVDSSVPTDFPVRCDEPFAGEDMSYVLYGSGGCSLYATEKLRALGCIQEIYEPAYVEDLDIGYRGWQRGWPTVFVAGARVLHQHRATTSRYFTGQELERVLEFNYLKFLIGAVASDRVFLKLWRHALRRLNLLAAGGNPRAREAMRFAVQAALTMEEAPAAPAMDEELILALGSGQAAVFPGRGQAGAPVLVSCAGELKTPSDEQLDTYREVVLVKEGATKAFEAVLEMTARKWSGSSITVCGR